MKGYLQRSHWDDVTTGEVGFMVRKAIRRGVSRRWPKRLERIVKLIRMLNKNQCKVLVLVL
jgi:hypothetical protein